MPKYLALFLISVALGAFRIGGVSHEIFQAIAHLFVGGLFAAYMVLRKYEEETEARRYYLTLGVALSLLEVACAVYFKVLK